MSQPIQLKAATLSERDLIDWSPLRRGFVLITLAFVCFGFPSTVRAQLSPAPDGGYPAANTAEGDSALFSLTTGWQNTADGYQALFSNTTGYHNTANGAFALFSNTTGAENTANGVEALFKNTTGTSNTANGYDALYSNTTGYQNTANGAGALFSNTIGNNNTANGRNALFKNTTGNYNTANGLGALGFNTTGSENTADGYSALNGNTTGVNNTANGFEALFKNTTGGNNVATGYYALQNNTGSNNIGLGSNAGSSLTTGNDNIDIGNVGVAAEAAAIRIGTKQTKTFIAGIRGVTTANAKAIPVLIDSTGQLGTTSSSRRLKKEIKAMDKTSEAILALKPVTFQYKSDNTGTPQFGLIAEEVAQVNPDLVVRDDDGEIYTVRYDAVNAMLLNEFLKEHRKVEALQANFAQQQRDFESKLAEQQKQIKALTAGLEKVNNQLELSKPAPQMAANSR
jgi:Chaperone of endosialidase